MLDRQKIRDEISDAARVRWDQLNEVGMQGIVAAECADIAMRILDAHGAFEQDGVAPYRPLPDDEEFIDILQGGSFYAEVTAFRRLAATIGVEQTYRKWTKLQRRARTANGRPLDEQSQAEQPQDDGDVRAVAALRDALRAGGRGWGEVDALIARFADRIAALDARDAKGGESA